MLLTLFWAILLRTGQIAVEASAPLLCGLIVAGVMRRMLGGEGTRRLFGGPGWKGLLRAWAIGTLLPVCSLGVIPIARAMRRAGVPNGTILAFVLAAPHINPLSLLYGLTLSEPFVIVCFAIGSLLVALLAGVIWDRLLARETDVAPFVEEPAPAPGPKRQAAVVLVAAQEAIGPTMGYVLLGLLFTGMLAGALPYGCLSTTMRHDNPFAPLLMLAVALPSYVGPLQGMMRLGLMFEHGNSVGAAFVLFELGIGVNIGLIAWLMRLFGWRRILVWLALLVVVTLALAYATERPLYFAHEEVGHTHAFDDWASPYLWGATVEPALVGKKVLEKVQTLELVALGGLALLVLLGLLVRKFDRQGRLERWLVEAPPSSTRPVSVWNRDVPGPVLGMVALLGLVGISIAALYIHYPDREDAFTEMVAVRADALTAVRSGHKEEAIRQIEHWDLVTRKLQVGVLIRTGEMNDAGTKATEDLRERLEELRDALLADDFAKAKEGLPALEAAYRACREAYPADAKTKGG